MVVGGGKEGEGEETTAELGAEVGNLEGEEEKEVGGFLPGTRTPTTGPRRSRKRSGRLKNGNGRPLGPPFLHPPHFFRLDGLLDGFVSPPKTPKNGSRAKESAEKGRKRKSIGKLLPAFCANNGKRETKQEKKRRGSKRNAPKTEETKWGKPRVTRKEEEAQPENKAGPLQRPSGGLGRPEVGPTTRRTNQEGSFLDARAAKRETRRLIGRNPPSRAFMEHAAGGKHSNARSRGQISVLWAGISRVFRPETKGKGQETAEAQ